MKRGILISVLILIFLICLISADFIVENYSIAKDYGPNSKITGWVNISLYEEPSDSVLKSSFGGSINLIDLLKKSSNSDFEYTCNPSSCTSDYIASNEEESKTFNLDEEDSVLFGFKIYSENIIDEISSFSFDLTSNNPETEKIPLAIDILNNGENEWEAYESSGNFGSENYGCFIGFGDTTIFPAKITQTPYCEKMGITQTPEVEIGAYVNYIAGTQEVPFTISVERIDTGESSNCEAIATGYGENERIACIPNNFHINQDGDYFVCIRTKNSADNGNYEIDYEQDEPCGFTGAYNDIYNYDFEIFARQAEYASEINITLNNEELENYGNSIDIESYIESYILSNYDDCSESCVVPIKIYSSIGQEVSISNALIEYSGVGEIATETRNLYDISETPATISTEKAQKLYLDDSGFRTPSEYDNYTFSVSLNDEELFSEKIFVGKVPVIKSLKPLTTGVKYPTTFTVDIDWNLNITKYVWDFGDGSIPQSTTIGEIVHTYNSSGNYLLKINVTDSVGKSSSKEFNITIAPASEIVPTLLANAEIDIANIKSEMTSFSQFEQKSINNMLKLDELESSITKLKDDASKATSEEEYETILGSLLGMKIPQSAAKIISSEEIIFYPQKENINLDILKKIGGGDYEAGKDDKYKKSILAWNSENIEKMSYSEISVIYENYEYDFLKIFDLTIRSPDTSYFIIKEIENLLFEKDYSEKQEDGYVYIELGTGKNIVFSTTEEVNFITLPAFVSPAINKLTLAEWSPFEETGELKKWVFFVIIVTFILFGALIAWGILQIWYKRKYENYLFKERNNLYNLINFIGAEKKKGINEKEIKGKLKKAGWSSEQLRYALRKYEGKITGLPEIISMEEILVGLKEIKEKKK